MENIAKSDYKTHVLDNPYIYLEDPEAILEDPDPPHPTKYKTRFRESKSLNIPKNGQIVHYMDDGNEMVNAEPTSHAFSVR